MTVKIKRIYTIPFDDDGKRILVDRLWPRGISKENAKVDLWLKEVAPSPELRKWYSHKPEKHDEFCNLYEHELSVDPIKSEAVRLLKKMSEDGAITLLYAAKDKVYNHAVILFDFILRC